MLCTWCARPIVQARCGRDNRGQPVCQDCLEADHDG